MLRYLHYHHADRMLKEPRWAMHLVGCNGGESLSRKTATCSASTLLEVLMVAHAVSVLDLGEATSLGPTAQLGQMKEAEAEKVHVRRRAQVQTAVDGLELWELHYLISVHL